MFVALYLPILKPGSANPNRKGFITSEEAWEYIYSQMCNTCMKERKAALDGVTEYHGWAPSRHPACACEWDVSPISDFAKDDLHHFIEFAR